MSCYILSCHVMLCQWQQIAVAMTVAWCPFILYTLLEMEMLFPFHFLSSCHFTSLVPWQYWCNILSIYMFFSLHNFNPLSLCTPFILINPIDGRIPRENSADVLLLNRQRSLRWDLQVRMRYTCLHWYDVMNWDGMSITWSVLHCSVSHPSHGLQIIPTCPPSPWSYIVLTHCSHHTRSHNIAPHTLLHCIFRNQLAKRLLNQRSASDEMERLMIGKLKLRCDYRYDIIRPSRLFFSSSLVCPRPSHTFSSQGSTITYAFLTCYLPYLFFPSPL